ncbi:MAG: MaoC family dehydratase [Promethearchaeota archaeon]
MEKNITITKKITKEDIQKFIQISGDINPIHTDEEFARKTIFKKPIAHGLISASIISAGLTKLMGSGNIWLTQQLNFEKPVYVGDEITAYLRVIDIDKRRVYTIETILKNQNNKVVISGLAECKVLPVR